MSTIIYGAGATGRLVAALLKRAGRKVEHVFCDSLKEPCAHHGFELAVQPSTRLRELCQEPSDYAMMIAVGYQHGAEINARRQELYDGYKKQGFGFVGLGDWLESVVLPQTQFHHGSKLGVNCFVSSGVVIGHDARIGDHVWVNSNVSIDGGAEIGDCCVLGSGAVIGAGIRLGHHTLVGPGAVVLRNTRPYSAHIAEFTRESRFSSTVYRRLG